MLNLNYIVIVHFSNYYKLQESVITFIANKYTVTMYNFLHLVGWLFWENNNIENFKHLILHLLQASRTLNQYQQVALIANKTPF